MSGNLASRRSNNFDFVRIQTMKLREARRRKFYSAIDLAEKAGVSAGTIYAIEAGRELPVLRTARKLAAALEIDPLEVDEFRAGLERLSGEKIESAV
jgi:DNA-binding XRE family transcriptional regulator